MSSTDGQPITVLHVDDEPDFADLVATFLERNYELFTVETAMSGSEGLETLQETRIDCIVSDHDMPGMDGLDFLRAVREDHPDLPFILFTGKGNEEIASDAISAGVTEYLQKATGTDQYAVLANRIKRAVSETRAKDALEKSERMLSTLISNLPGMAYRCRNEPDWPMEFVSDGCRDLTGYDSSALLEGEIAWGEDIVLPEEQDRLWEAVQGAIDDGESFEVTYLIRTAEGETKWVWEQGRCVYDEGDECALEGIILDVDDRMIGAGTTETHEDTDTEWILEGMGDGLLAVDGELTITTVTDRGAELIDSDTDTLRGSTLGDVLPAHFGTELVPSVEKAMAIRERVTAEVADPSGDASYEARIVPSERGASIQFLDVTGRNEREGELERYRTLVENVGDSMYMLDTDARITMANQAMADHLGYEREEIVGSHASRFMPESDVETGTDLILELLESDRTWGTFEMETIHADGTRTVSEDKVAALTDDRGEFVGSVGVIRDISERMARELELERYETIIQAVDDPVYALDEEARITFVNEAIEPMTGFEPAELLGEHVSVLVDDADTRQGVETVRELLGDPDRTYATYEVELRTKDGGTVPVENHLALLPTDDGFTGTAGVLRDITERKQRERRLEEFASVVSHDLQSPLNVIIGRTELALESGNVENLADVLTAADRMEALIEDLLALAKHGDVVGTMESVRLSSVASEAWDTVATVEASLEVVDDGTIEADPDRLRELLSNLVTNAVLHGGEDVTVRVGTLADGFYVADDGPGIEPDRRETVFDHGHSTAEDGTGLGLTIVSRIAEAHDWSITLTESELDGARFEFRT